MQFADFKPAMSIDCGSHAVTEREIIEFAQRHDPQWFHIDPARALTSRWKGLIGSGWMTCCIAMRLAVRHLLDDSECFGSPGIENVQWEQPVRPGDTLQLAVTVLSTRVSSSGRNGIVRWRWELRNQNSERVLNLVATSLFDLAQAEPNNGG